MYAYGIADFPDDRLAKSMCTGYAVTKLVYTVRLTVPIPIVRVSEISAIAHIVILHLFRITWTHRPKRPLCLL